MNISDTSGKKHQVKVGMNVCFDTDHDEELQAWVESRTASVAYPDHGTVVEYDSVGELIWVEGCEFAIPASQCTAL